MTAIMLPWPSRDLHPNARVHWARRAKAAKKARADARIATLAAKLPELPPGVLALWVTWYPPDRRRRDDDGLIASFKAARDGIADALGIDDSRFRVIPYLSDKPRQGGVVEVKITNMPEIGG